MKDAEGFSLVVDTNGAYGMPYRLPT